MIAIPIFMSSDNNYAPFVATTMASICANTKSFIDFYVLDGGIAEANRRQIEALRGKFNKFTLEFIPVNAGLMFKYFTLTKDLWTLSAYNRLLIPTLKPQIERSLYIDVDSIALGDITEFYEHALDGNIIAAPPCLFTHDYEADAWDKLKHDLAIADGHKYFWDSHLLIDNKKWRENGITEKLFSIERQYTTLIWGDMDIINKGFDGNNYKIISNRFGLSTTDIMWLKKFAPAEYAEISSRIVLRHFEGYFKPWLTNKADGKIMKLENFSDFWEYAKMTQFYADLNRKYVENQRHNEKNRQATLLLTKLRQTVSLKE